LNHSDHSLTTNRNQLKDHSSDYFERTSENFVDKFV